MNCKIPHCRDSAFKYGLCRKHWKKSVRIAIGMIDDVRKKNKDYERFHVKENFGIFG